MKSKHPRRLGFKVDKLTNSIENILTGDVFDTVVTRVQKEDLLLIRNGLWQFDWLLEIRDSGVEVYKLTIRDNPSIIQGLISLSDRQDHIFMNLLESAHFNIGRLKMYDGVAGNLAAFACKRSFELGYEGFLSFESKTRLISHYETSLGAKRNYGNRMLLDKQAATELVRRYFKEFDHA